MNFCKRDTETDVCLLLDKLKKNGDLDDFHSFSNDVVKKYKETSFDDDMQISLIIDIIEEKSVSFNFFQKLSLYEQELIGALIVGYLDGDEWS